MKEYTQKYYNLYAKEYSDYTFNIDMTDQYKFFEIELSTEMSILDVGCGSGRDTLYFLKKGYHVDAIDYSSAMCKKASKNLGWEPTCAYVNNYNTRYTKQYDGIWCCASLLHIFPRRLPITLEHLSMMLKQNGIIYLSFKYGDETIVDTNGRFFNNMNELSVKELLNNIPNLFLKNYLTSVDKEGTVWLNLLLFHKPT